MPTKCCTFNHEHLLFLPFVTQQMKGNNPICVALSQEARESTFLVIVLGIYSLQTLLFQKYTQECLKMPQNPLLLTINTCFSLTHVMQQQKKTILFVLRHPRKPGQILPLLLFQAINHCKLHYFKSTYKNATKMPTKCLWLYF